MGDNNADLEMALAAARKLYHAAETLKALASGGAYSYNAASRESAKAVAVKDWVGGTKDTFEASLYANESESTATSIIKMRHEAEDWAAFWTDTINNREQQDYNEAMSLHQSAVQEYELAQSSEMALYSGRAPIPPAEAKVYSQPTAPYFTNPSI